MNNVSPAIGSSSEKKEGPVAKTIEEQTAKIPSDVWLWAATGAIFGSAVLQLLGNRTGFMKERMMGAPMRLRHLSLFVGQWAPTFLMLGLYNKIVKVAGSDRESSYRGSY